MNGLYDGHQYSQNDGQLLNIRVHFNFQINGSSNRICSGEKIGMKMLRLNWLNLFKCQISRLEMLTVNS